MKNRIISKMLVAALASALIIGMTGCGSQSADSDAGSTADKAQTTETTVETDTDSEAATDSDSTESAEGTVVKPQQQEVDINNISDGIYHVSFGGDAVVDDDGQLYLDNVDIYTEDVYDIVDMSNLKAGDSIVVDDEEIKVTSVENKDGSIYVNGDIGEGGLVFYTQENSNGWFCRGIDDRTSYSFHGTGTYKISENVVYTDTADLDNRVEGGYDGLEDVIAESADHNNGYSQYNTTIRIENGEIVEITRSYTP